MATFFYTTGLADIVRGDVDVSAGKFMLVNDVYVPDKSHLVVDGDVAAAEISVSGYTPGWGSASRQAAPATIEADVANFRVEFQWANTVWPTLDVGAIVAALIWIHEGVADDTTSRLLAYLDVSDVATDGSDLSVTFNATDGNLRITV